MWILTFFPDLLVHLVFVAGLLLFLAATFLGMIPIINTYKTPAQIVGVIVLAIGIYLEGGLAYKEKQAVAVAELEAKLAEANAKAEKKNTEIVTKVVKDTKIIRQKGDDVIKYIDREIVKYDDQCLIPNEVIEAHNRAATLSTGPSTTQAAPPASPVEKESKLILPPRTNQ